MWGKSISDLVPTKVVYKDVSSTKHAGIQETRREGAFSATPRNGEEAYK